MQSTARGLLSGAVWGLLVGSGVLVVATLALDARRTARLDAERLSARPEAPVALAQGQSLLESFPRPALPADAEPRGTAPKSDQLIASPQGYKAVQPEEIVALGSIALPKLPAAPAAIDMASALTDPELLARPEISQARKTLQDAKLVRRAPSPLTISPLIGGTLAVPVLRTTGMQIPVADAPQDIVMGVAQAKPHFSAPQISGDALRNGETAARAVVPTRIADLALTPEIPRVDPAPSSRRLDVPFVMLPDAARLSATIGATPPPPTTRQPVRFGRLSWAPQLARSALNSPRAPELSGTSDLRGPEPVMLDLAPRRPDESWQVSARATDQDDPAMHPRADGAVVSSPDVPQVLHTLLPPIPARLILASSQQALDVPRIVLVVAEDDEAVQTLPDWAGSIGVRPGTTELQTTADPRVAAIWLRAGDTEPIDESEGQSPSVVLLGPNAPIEQMTAVRQSGQTFAPIYRHIETADAQAQVALQAALLRAARDGHVIIMVANDAKVFAVVDQWLVDQGEAVRPVLLETVIR